MDILAGVQPVAFRAQQGLDELEGVTDRELLADAGNGRVDHALARMVLGGGLAVALQIGLPVAERSTVIGHQPVRVFAGDLRKHVLVEIPRPFERLRAAEFSS
jgi:hypothetical protein